MADITLVLTRYPEDARLREMVASHLVDVGIGNADPAEWLGWLKGRLIGSDQDPAFSGI